MMIYRQVQDRLAHLASFLLWDPDPYLVITDDGRLVWMVDGYTTSLSHPYSATLPVTGLDEGANYIRNAVKATVDAYTGEMSLYVFDPTDPIIQAYQHLFPKLFRPASEMPADLRRHTRYPEVLFRAQAEAYRTFHMRDPQVFYNKEDIWEIARNLFGQSGQPEPVQPTYVVATLPGEKEPEFLLILPFTPRGKDNLIGWMAARCDGDRLGNLVYFQLSKQQLMYGPMQIESRIDQDQNISKDLTLWNQQGSHVLRGNIIALPVTGGFLYVESIYIQATEARMPQLKKVVLAMGDRLIYRDTFSEALAELTGAPARPQPPSSATAHVRNSAPLHGQRTKFASARRAAQPSAQSGRTTDARAGGAGKRDAEEIVGAEASAPAACYIDFAGRLLKKKILAFQTYNVCDQRLQVRAGGWNIRHAFRCGVGAGILEKLRNSIGRQARMDQVRRIVCPLAVHAMTVVAHVSAIAVFASQYQGRVSRYGVRSSGDTADGCGADVVCEARHP